MLKKVNINTDFIKLGQLLKLVGLITNGAEAKMFLEENKVLVNNEYENRRGRKIYSGDLVKVNEIEVEVNGIYNKN